MIDAEEMHFTPLESCAVVDSRLGSRKELREAIDETGLFFEVYEPPGITETLNFFEKSNVDACIIGASVSQSGFMSFIQGFEKRVHSSDCALLFAANEQTKRSRRSEEKFGRRFTFPCTTVELYNQVTESVEKACNNKKKLKLLEQHNRLVESRLYSSDAQSFRFSLSESFLGSTSAIVDIISNITGASSNDDEVDPAMIDTVRNLLIAVESRTVEAQEIQQFQKHLNGCVRDWFQDVVTIPAGQATDKLRDCLLSYKKEVN